jgi:palmitoyltransferase ZDHHC13/17
VQKFNYNSHLNLLLDNLGGDLNATPLQWASRQGHLASCVLLMNAGADPSIKDAEGCSSLHLAAQFGHTAVVAYLIARNANPDDLGEFLLILLISLS